MAPSLPRVARLENILSRAIRPLSKQNRGRSASNDGSQKSQNFWAYSQNVQNIWHCRVTSTEYKSHSRCTFCTQGNRSAHAICPLFLPHSTRLDVVKLMTASHHSHKEETLNVAGNKPDRNLDLDSLVLTCAPSAAKLDRRLGGRERAWGGRRL